MNVILERLKINSEALIKIKNQVAKADTLVPPTRKTTVEIKQSIGPSPSMSSPMTSSHLHSLVPRYKLSFTIVETESPFSSHMFYHDIDVSRHQYEKKRLNFKFLH